MDENTLLFSSLFVQLDEVARGRETIQQRCIRLRSLTARRSKTCLKLFNVQTSLLHPLQLTFAQFIFLTIRSTSPIVVIAVHLAQEDARFSVES